MLLSCTGPDADLEGYVPDGTDLDGEFVLRCVETGEALTVRGWMISDLEIAEPPPFTMTEAETVATVYRSFQRRHLYAGAVGYVVELGEGRVRVVTADRSVVIRSTAAGWGATFNEFEGIDPDLEAAISLAIGASNGRAK